MARNNKIRMPSSTAGITQYFDEFKGKFSIKPQVVVLIIAIIIIAILVIKSMLGGVFS